MKLTLLLILMAITVGYCGKNKTDLSDWRKVFEQGEGSSRPSMLRRNRQQPQQKPKYQYPGISNCVCGMVNEARQARIVGGNETIPHRYPWAAFVHYMHQGIYSQYGVSIITTWHLLTTAKVVDGVPVKDLFVSVGVHKVNNINEPSEEFSVERVVKHPLFIKGNKTFPVPTHDMAIIITEKAITFAANIGPVCLPWGNFKFERKYLTALGWGGTLVVGDISVLRELDLFVIPNDYCTSFYPNQNLYTELCVTKFKKGTCTGDEGGCLLNQNQLQRIFTQVGVISYNAPDCRSKPTVAADVRYFIKWISEVIVGSNKRVTACYGV